MAFKTTFQKLFYTSSLNKPKITLRADTEQRRNHVCRERSHWQAGPRVQGYGSSKRRVQRIKLSDYKGKYVVLFFYPLDLTFVCPTEIISFSKRAEEFHKISAEVIGATVDSHLTWTSVPRKDGGLRPMKIPLLADLTKSISRDSGVLKEDDGVAFRGLFIIGNKGILHQITINDLPMGRSVDEVLRLVQVFQFTDQHGKVCPAGWKTSSSTARNTSQSIIELPPLQDVMSPERTPICTDLLCSC